MGVNGLWKLVSPCAQYVDTKVFTGRTAAIDASIWLAQFINAVKSDDGKPVAGSYIIGFLKRTTVLFANHIYPVFVFDGRTPSLKTATLIRRFDEKRKQELSIRGVTNKLIKEFINKRNNDEQISSNSQNDDHNDKVTAVDMLIGKYDEVENSEQKRRLDTFVTHNNDRHNINLDQSKVYMKNIIFGNSSERTTMQQTGHSDSDDSTFGELNDEAFNANHIHSSNNSSSGGSSSVDSCSDVDDAITDEEYFFQTEDYCVNVPNNDGSVFKFKIRSFKDFDSDKFKKQSPLVRFIILQQFQKDLIFHRNREMIEKSNSLDQFSERQLGTYMLGTLLNKKIEDTKKELGEIYLKNTSNANDSAQAAPCDTSVDQEFLDLLNDEIQSKTTNNVNASTDNSQATHDALLPTNFYSVIRSKKFKTSSGRYWNRIRRNTNKVRLTQASWFSVFDKAPQATTEVKSHSASATQQTNKHSTIEKFKYHFKGFADVSRIQKHQTSVDVNPVIIDMADCCSGNYSLSPLKQTFASTTSYKNDIAVNNTDLQNNNYMSINKLKSLQQTTNEQPVTETLQTCRDSLTAASILQDLHHGSSTSDIASVVQQVCNDDMSNGLIEKMAAVGANESRSSDIGQPADDLLKQSSNNMSFESRQPSNVAALAPYDRFVDSTFRAPTTSSSGSIATQSIESIINSLYAMPAEKKSLSAELDQLADEYCVNDATEQRSVDDNDGDVVTDLSNLNIISELISSSIYEFESKVTGINKKIKTSQMDEFLDSKLNEAKESFSYINSSDEYKDFKSELYSDITELLDILGIPYVVAPEEAEAQMCEMCKSNIVDFILSEDSDCIVFGGSVIVRSFFNRLSDKIQMFNIHDIYEKLGLSRELLSALSALVGCDYTEGVSGIGIVNGLETVCAYGYELKDLENFKEWSTSLLDTNDPGINDNDSSILVEYKKKHKTYRRFWIFPDDFPSKDVITALKEPVTNKNSIQLQWRKPMYSSLRSFLKKKTQLLNHDIEKTIIDVSNVYNKIKPREFQTTLSRFFAPAFAPEKHIKSKRIISALEHNISKKQKLNKKQQ